MATRLVSQDGHADIPIDRVLIVVGRHALCDVRLDSQRVSRRHCCLAIDRAGVLVRDLGSANGTRINGRRVDVGLLVPGDELEIAHRRFRLEIREAAARAALGADPGRPAPAAPDPPGAGPAPDGSPGEDPSEAAGSTCFDPEASPAW